MKHNALTIFKILFVIMIIAISCEKENGENETKISSYNGDESHKIGQNCMDCHKQGGSGDGWFTIAGTVYDSLKVNTYPNATVKLYTEPDGAGELKYTVQADALGNFYSTESINFGDGLYTSVQGDILTKHMITPVQTGQCNSCHGTSVAKIWTK